MSEMRNCKRLPVIPELQTVTGITLSLVRPTSLDGKQLVTFEELYDLSNPDEPKKVTEHKDIEDKGQTITFKEKPEEPEKPETPPTPEKPNRPSDSPKTGDSTNVMACRHGIVFIKKRKKPRGI